MTEPTADGSGNFFCKRFVAWLCTVASHRTDPPMPHNTEYPREPPIDWAAFPSEPAREPSTRSDWLAALIVAAIVFVLCLTFAYLGKANG